MTADNALETSTGTSPSRASRLACLALALVAIAASFGAWAQSGNVGHFVVGLGFVVWAPVWYQVPISFTAPLGSQLRQRRQLTRLQSAQVWIGFLLLGVGLVLRWAT